MTRTTSDGATTYTAAFVNNGPDCALTSSTTTIAKPDKSGESISFVPANSASHLDFNTLETAHSWLNSSGATVRSTTKCYNGSASPCTTAAVTLPITEISTTTTLNDISSAQTSQTVQFFNANSLQTELDEYDFGASTLTRKTATAYPPIATCTTISNRPCQVTVTDGANNQIAKTTYGYDEYTLASSGLATSTELGQAPLTPVTGSRGNRTSEHDWVNTTGATLDSHWCYDNAGQVVASQDPAASAAFGQSCLAGKATIYGHDATDTYVTSTTLPTPSSGVVVASSATYYPNAGLLHTTTDPNGTRATYTYDSMLRQNGVSTADSGNNPVGKQATNTYVDAPAYHNTNDTENQQYQSGSAYQDTWELYDAYGRPSRSAVANGQGSNPWYQQDTCYNSMGQLSFQSYRYQGAGFPQAAVCSGAGDSYSNYDALGRVKTITHADGTAIIYNYTGRATEVTDENLVSRVTQVDALGRTTVVCEVSTATLLGVTPSACGLDIPAVGFLTTYTYTTDTLNSNNQKTAVTQGAQTRTIETDSLGRTVSVSEPERGVTNYSYAYSATAGLGLTVTRTRPQANQTNPSVPTTTTTQYDALGRVVSVTYNDNLTPNKYFNYDTYPGGWAGQATTNTKGRLIVMGAILGSSAATNSGALYSYDPMGRITETWQCGPDTCGTAYQASHWVSLDYDWAGNVIYESDPAAGNINFGRSPAGEITSITNQTYSLSGASGSAPLLSNPQNGPNGPVSFEYGNGLSQYNSYDTLGRINGGWVCIGAPSWGCPNQRNGFVVSWSGSRAVGSGENYIGEGLTYQYDDFNRLSGMKNSAGQTTFIYTYDRYGNRWSQTAASGSGPQPSYTFNSATNQIAGYTYDAAGNMTYDGFHNYAYDAEGNVLQVDPGQSSSWSFVFDALNRRVRANIPGGGVSDAVYDPAGRIISGWASPTTLQESHIYADSQQIAYRGGDGKTYFVHRNWMGADRVHTDMNGQTGAVYTSLPFGDGGADTVSEQYAGWDFEHFGVLDVDYWSNTCHAQFRNYSPTQGRWLSPDPYDGSYDATNPQSLNRYAYVLNNPLSLIDPLGLELEDLGGGCFQDITRWTITSDGGGANDGAAPTSSSGVDFGGTVCLNYGLGIAGYSAGSAPANSASSQTTPAPNSLFTLSNAPSKPGTQSNNPPKRTSCLDTASKTMIRDLAIGEGVGAASGAVIGGLVAGGFTVATDTYPLAGATIPAGIVGGTLIGAVEALPLTTIGSIVDGAFTYFTCP